MNKVILTGRITKDPEVRYTQQGVSVVSFTIAVNRQYRDANGNNQADFINCTAWRSTADFITRYIKKGIRQKRIPSFCFCIILALCGMHIFSTPYSIESMLYGVV